MNSHPELLVGKESVFTCFDLFSKSFLVCVLCVLSRPYVVKWVCLNFSKVAPPLRRRYWRLGSLSLEVTLSLPLKRHLNRTNPLRCRPFPHRNTSLGRGINNNQMEEPQTYDSDSDRDSLEQPNVESPIHEGSPPISQVVPCTPIIQETPT